MQVLGNVSGDSTAANQPGFPLLRACGHLGEHVFVAVKSILCRARDALCYARDTLFYARDALFRRSHQSQHIQNMKAQPTNRGRATGDEQSTNKKSSSSSNTTSLDLNENQKIVATGAQILAPAVNSSKKAHQSDPKNFDMQSLDNKERNRKNENIVKNELDGQSTDLVKIRKSEALNAELIQVQKNIEWYSKREGKFQRGNPWAEHFTHQREEAEARLLVIMKDLVEINGHTYSYSGGYSY